MIRPFLAVFLLPVLQAQPYVVTTVAGGGTPPLTAIAAQSQVGLVAGIAADGSGNEYISSENCVFRIDSSGVMRRVAGNGRPGYSGDGGAAIDAQLNNPGGLALDASANLYIADSGNEVIRKVTPDGKIRTVPGSAIYPVQNHLGSHVAVSASGDLFIANKQANAVWRLSRSGSISRFAGNGQSGYTGDGGPATLAAAGGPVGVAVDGSGNVFVAQSAAVRKVTPAGIITTVAGTGTSGESGDGGLATQARLSLVLGIAVDSSGALYIAELTRLRKVSSNGIITTIAGGQSFSAPLGDGGPAVNAALTRALGVAITVNGDLYIADNARVRHVNGAGMIETLEGGGESYTGDGGPATAAQLYSPSGITLDAQGNLYIADSGSRIRKVSPGGIITTYAGGPTFGYSGDGGPAVDAQMEVYPLTGMATDPAGDLIVVETLNNDVREVTAQGAIQTFANSATSQPFSFTGLAMDGSGNLFVTDSTFDLIRKIDTAGNISTFVSTNSSQETRTPYALAIDGANNVYVTYSNALGVTRFSPAGSATELVPNALNQQAIAVGATGNMYALGASLSVIAPDGTTTYIGQEGFSYPVEGSPALGISMITPTALAVDTSGDIFITDSGANAVFKLHPVSGPLPPAIAGVYESAAGMPAPVTPGEAVLVYGSGMGPASPVAAAAGTAVTALGGTQVLFDEIPAALLSVSATQISAVVPYGVSGSAKVTVRYGGLVSAPFTVPVGWTVPERGPKSLVVPKRQNPSPQDSF